MLWSNVEHFVLMDKEIETGTISDIDTKSFSVGPQASGTEQSTLVIMEGLGLTKENITPEYLGYDDTISAMRDGRLDGGSLPAGVPVSSIMDMAASGVKASVLDVTDEHQRALMEAEAAAAAVLNAEGRDEFEAALDALLEGTTAGSSSD